MTTPVAGRCTGVRMGGRKDDWQDIPCPELVTTTYDGQPMCAGCRDATEQREREKIAETFFERVAIERLRAIAGAGGLKELLHHLDQFMVAAGDMIEPLIGHVPLPPEAVEIFERTKPARDAARAFLEAESEARP